MKVGGVCAIALLLCIFAYWSYRSSRSIAVVSKTPRSPSNVMTVDETYTVVLDIHDKLMRILFDHYGDHPGVKRIRANWSGIIKHVGDPSKQGFGYNVEKGNEIGLCFKYGDDGRSNDVNDITYILLHELAHIMTEAYSHDSNFRRNLKFLQDVARRHRLYEPVDYRTDPVQFCEGILSE